MGISDPRISRSQHPRYAILSHRWEEDEITFQEMLGPSTVNKKGFEKITYGCMKARKDGFQWIWIDTCCIDKTSSTELSEAINSMFRWYQEADVCYAYLSDVLSRESLLESKWFTRGFTLQELIAPPMVMFLDKEWKELGTKESLKEEISRHTQIPVNILSGDDDVDNISIAQRMSWAAKRQTSRLEDQAYCLLGLFGINMPLIYGEGNMAFIRLQEEIMKVSDDQSIFAWESESEIDGGLLATSPSAFERSANVIVKQDPLFIGQSSWDINNKGIHVELPFIGIGPQRSGIAVLQCTRDVQQGQWIAIHLKDLSLTMKHFERVECDKLEVVDLQRLRPSQFPLRRICVKERRLAMSRTRKHKIKHTKTARPASLYDCRKLTGFELLHNAMKDDEYQSTEGSADINKVDEKGRALLSYLAEKGDVVQVLQALAHPNARVNLADQYGLTPLFYAAKSGHVGVVWLLLRRNAKPDLKDLRGRTPLSLAAEHGHVEVVWLLLTRTDVEVYSIDSFGMTPLAYAAQMGNEAIIRIFDGRDDFTAHLKDANGQTLLSLASKGGQEGVVRMLLTRSDMEPDMQDDGGQMPLWQAAARGYSNVVEILLDHGADIDAKDSHGKTAMWLAVVNSQEHTAELLLSHGANVTTKGGSALCLPASNHHHHVRLLKWMISIGAEIEPNDGSGRGILHWAARNRADDLFRSLLNHIVDVHAADCSGRTPLLYAVELGHEGIVQLLLEHDPNTESESGFENTPLYTALHNQLYRIVERLLSHGANPNLRRGGKSILLIAMEQGHDNTVLKLLHRGANPNTVVGNAKLIMEWAIERRNEKYVHYLLASHADPNAMRNGYPIIFRAMYYQNEAIVNGIIKSGANLSVKDKYGRDAYEYAKVLRYDLKLRKKKRSIFG